MIKKYLILILICLAFSVGSQSQDFLAIGKYNPNSLLETVQSNSYVKPYDVLHYKLDAKPAMVDSSFVATMEMKILITIPTDTLHLNSFGLIFSNVEVNGSSASYTLYPSSETFSIYLPRIFTLAETVKVKIDYSRDLTINHPWRKAGYYWHRKGSQFGVEENIGYTMSEPSDARRWMPCNDDPADKATCEINITVPEGYQAASNGLLIGVVNNPDNTVTYKWREDLPITTYLMSITASKYSIYKQHYRRVTNPSDSIEIVNYIWQVDSAGATWNARLAFSKVPQMMEVFSTIFGEYPFVKYGHAVIYPFVVEGMEHQTISSLHRGWISVNAYPFYDDWIAHELAHQWWGDLVTCKTWPDIWLNEGFATYSEFLWREYAYGIPSRDSLIKLYTRFTDLSWQYAIYDPVSQGINLFTSNVYQKAAWVLHMLRYLVGDTTFFSIIRNYRDAHYYGTAITQDFIDIVNATTGQNYNWFFNQWIFGKGWLKLSYNTNWDSQTNNYTVILYQQQDITWSLYKMPVEIKIFYQGSDTTFTVWDSLRVQSFVFNLNTQPDSLQIDPGNKILKQLEYSPVSVDDLIVKGYKLYQNYPNPFNSNTKIKFTILDTGRISLTVFDVLGRVVAILADNELLYPGDYEKGFDANKFGSGVYYYQLKVGSAVSTKKMVLIR